MFGSDESRPAFTIDTTGSLLNMTNTKALPETVSKQFTHLLHIALEENFGCSKAGSTNLRGIDSASTQQHLNAMRSTLESTAYQERRKQLHSNVAAALKTKFEEILQEVLLGDAKDLARSFLRKRRTRSAE